MSKQEISKHLPVDSTVVAAFMIGGRPMAISCLVTSEAPLYLFTKDLRVLDLEYPQTIVLVWHRGADVLKGEADAIRVMPWKTGNVLEIMRTNLKEVDRRVYPRYHVQSPVSIRSVTDVQTSTVIAVSQGQTKDISLGGSWIAVEPTLPKDALVEFKCNVNGVDVCALGLVVHENKENGTNGIEFMDFFDDSRDKLYSALKKSA
ncbi:MAG: PilZ domain-containing protein [Armatimonadota bacterium]